MVESSASHQLERIQPVQDSEPVIAGAEEQEPSQPSITPAISSLDAWLSVVAGFFIFMDTWGITHPIILVVVMGVIGGPLTDEGYTPQLMAVGCFLISFGLFMLSLSTEYYQIVLAQGVCVGLGSGLVYIPAIAAISNKFTKGRPFALGCASAGSGIGGVIFPIMFRRLQPTIGFAWTIRAIAFINLDALAISLLILSREKQRKDKKRMFFDIKAFTETPFASFAIARLLIFVPFYVPLFYISDYAMVALGANESYAYYLLAINDGGSFFGRLLPLLIANKMGSMQTFAFWTVASIIVLFSWLAIDSITGFTVWCVVWGFVSGVLVTVPNACIPHPTLSPSMGVIGTRLGMSWITSAVGILIGTPIAGALVDLKNADFAKGIIFAGTVMAGGAACLMPPLMAVLKYKSTNKDR